MKVIPGWRIQVRPQYCYADLTTSSFHNVEIADEAGAIASVRNRPDATPGERVYAVRPLRDDEVGKPAMFGG